MGMTTSAAIDLWGRLRLPRTSSGELDGREFLRLVARSLPMLVALWGVLWLSGQGIATDRLDLAIALITAIPLWVASRAWRLPWWLTLGAASLPLSIAVVALSHGEWAGLVRGTKMAYGALLFLGVVAWARSPVRRVAIALSIALFALYGFLQALWTWLAVAQGPWDLMKGTIDWHNQFAIQMLYGLSIGLVLAVLGRGTWAWVAMIAASICGAGVVLSGSRYGFALGVLAAAVSLALGISSTRNARRWHGLVRWGTALVGTLLLPILLRSPIFFPGTEAAFSPIGTMTQRGGLVSSGEFRLEWWRSAVEIGLERPLTGAGLLSFDTETVCHGTIPQWHPHNEWAYAWAEGGMVALLPTAVALAGAAFLITRVVARGGNLRVWLMDPGVVAGGIAVLLAVVHLVAEYDLYYSILVALFALSAATGLARGIPANAEAGRMTVITAWVAVLATLAVAFAAIAMDPTFDILPWKSGYSVACTAN